MNILVCYSQIFGKVFKMKLALVYFFYRNCLDTPECTALVKEYPKDLQYSGLSIILYLDLDRGGKILNIRVCPPKVAAKWQS